MGQVDWLRHGEKAVLGKIRYEVNVIDIINKNLLSQVYGKG